MENRRLGQSDRGGGTKRKHRARCLVGLTLACCLALGVSACSASVESNEQAAAVEQKIVGPDGHVIYGAKGVVDFSYSIELPEKSIPVSCTGSMIAPHVVLTAARCFFPFSAAPPHGGKLTNIQIYYYDPSYGRRLVHDGPADWKSHPSFPGYTCDGPCCDLDCIEGSDFFNKVTRARNDRKHGRTRVHPGPFWFRFPGEIEPFVADEADTAKNDLAVIIVPEELGSLIPEAWPTDYHDYLRIFSEPGRDHLGGYLNAFGAGLYDYDPQYTDDQLRYANFDTFVENNNSPGPDYLRLEGRQNDDRVNMCRGDNGGPIEYSINVEGQSVPTVAAVWSGFNIGVEDPIQDPSVEPPYCANNNRTHDDSYGCIVNDEHVQWIEGAAGLSCVDQTGGSLGYKRCFDLPMIEDAPGEGLYAPNVATAIAMSAL